MSPGQGNGASPPAGPVLLVKGKAGLGNRLLLLLDSILYAEMTGRRLVIDWRDRAYAVEGQNSFNEYFAAPLAGDPAQYDHATSVTPPAWRDHMELTADGLLHHYHPGDDGAEDDPQVKRRTSVDTRRRDLAAQVLVRWGWTHELHNLRRAFSGRWGRFAAMSDDQVLRTVMREHLVPAPVVAEKVAALRAKFAGPTIALHVRYSDRKNPFEGYGRFVDRFLAEHPQGGGVFLATDNAEVQGYFRARYPRVYTIDKWFPPEGTPIHRGPGGRDVIGAGIDALTDMYALGACDALVYNSTSTFGVIAALISQAPTRWIIDTAPSAMTPKERMKLRVKRVRNYLHARGLSWPIELP